MKVLLLALFVAAVSAGSFKVGTIKCTFGPSYWCQNYKQAKECNAIKHCQENVWKVKVSASNVTCDACVEVLTFLKTELTKPDFEKTIEEYLEKVCVSFGALADECKALIEQYGPLLFQELASLLSDPKQECTKLDLCTASKEKIMATLLSKALPVKLVSSFKPRKHVLKSKYSVKSSAECILCEFIAKELDGILGNNATQKEIVAALDKVCSFLPSSLSSECTSFINQYGPTILQILSQELNPSIICSTLGLCASKEHKLAMMKPHKLKIGSQETCEICTVVMTYLKSKLKDNATEDEIIKELLMVCNYLPEQIASECNAIVKEYGKEVLELIANADAKTLCTEIGLCTANMKISSMKLKGLKKNTGGKPKCYLGASFWCANHKNAIKCNAVDFCKKFAW